MLKAVLLEHRWMPGEPMDLVLEHLRAIRDHMDDMKHMFYATDHRLTRIEATIVDMQCIRADKARTIARFNGKFDMISRDVDMISRDVDAIKLRLDM
eukprot:gene2481-3353_t